MKLNAASRNVLPSSDFAMPGQGSGASGKGSGSYPIPDESHARNALSRIAQNGSPGQQAAVKAKVKAKFPGIDSDGDNDAPDAKNVAGASGGKSALFKIGKK